MQAEMKAWENYALKRLGKLAGVEFEPRAIDVLTAMRIKGALARGAKSARRAPCLPWSVAASV